MHTVFVRKNKDPVPIEQIEDEHDETRDFEPSFWWENHRHYLSDYNDCHNNPFISTEYPEHIHKLQNDGSRQSFENPLYLEFIDDTHINIYQSRHITI